MSSQGGSHEIVVSEHRVGIDLTIRRLSTIAQKLTFISWRDLDLFIEPPTKFELVINLETANAPGPATPSPR